MGLISQTIPPRWRSGYVTTVNAVAASVHPLRWPRREIALLVLFAAWMQVDVWGARPFAFGHMVGPRPVVALLYAVTSFALFWRRHAPLAVLSFIVTAGAAEYLAFGAPQGLGSFLPLFFAFYSVGRYARVGSIALAGPLVMLGLAVHELKDPAFNFDGFSAFYWLVLTSAWPLGLAFQRRASEADALVTRARELTRERDRSAKVAADAERNRIARELHDVVGHSLSVIVLQVVAALETLDSGDLGVVHERLLSTEQTARDALGEMRRLLDLLDDGELASLVPHPGLDQLERLVADTRAAGASVDVTLTGTAFRLPSGIDLAAFRILQESLTNVLKHARPPRAHIGVCYGPDAVVLEVLDEGRAAVERNPAGRGLAGMRERVSVYGGELAFGPTADGGYLVRARLPVAP
jgi:signal transduction histidine kinase